MQHYIGRRLILEGQRLTQRHGPTSPPRCRHHRGLLVAVLGLAVAAAATILGGRP